MRAEIDQAIQLLQRVDDADLEQALTLLENAVFSFRMRVCGQREDAEDTMQEVLLKSVPHLPKFDSPKALLQPGVGTGRRLLDLGGALHVQSFVGTLMVEDLHESVEAGLLL
jgi:Sigma-70 region 2